MENKTTYLFKSGVIDSKNPQRIKHAGAEYVKKTRRDYFRTYYTRFRWIKIKLTEKEVTALTTHLKARKQKLTTTTIKLLALERANDEIFIHDEKAINKIINSINAWGNNINQIALVANSTGNLYESDILKTRHLITKLIQFVEHELKATRIKTENNVTENHHDN